MPSTKMHHDRLIRLIATAIDGGAMARSISHYEWNLAPKCQFPVVVELTGRPAEKRLKRGSAKEVNVLGPDGDGSTVMLTLGVPCRKCDPCRKARRNLWWRRARSEVAASTRTWFGTLTLSPESHERMANQARRKAARQGEDFDLKSMREQFLGRHSEVSRELTLYLKRIRKESQASLRYLLVAEAHTSGLPHYHVLIHETGNPGVRHATLRHQWKLGFTKFTLLRDVRSASYITKYLAKDASARVRASFQYGTRPNVIPSLEQTGVKRLTTQEKSIF